MQSHLSTRERLLVDVLGWSWFPGLYLLSFIIAWRLHGRPELLERWLDLEKYLAALLLGLQVATFVFLVRRSGIVPAVLFFIGGVSLLGFGFSLQVWLLLLSGGASGAGGICLAWPQMRDLFHRLAGSYREMSESKKL